MCQDLGDIQDIFLAQGQLDEEYLRVWATELGVEGKLREVKAQFENDS